MKLIPPLWRATNQVLWAASILCGSTELILRTHYILGTFGVFLVLASVFFAWTEWRDFRVGRKSTPLRFVDVILASLKLFAPVPIGIVASVNFDVHDYLLATCALYLAIFCLSDGLEVIYRWRQESKLGVAV